MTNPAIKDMNSGHGLHAVHGPVRSAESVAPESGVRHTLPAATQAASSTHAAEPLETRPREQGPPAAPSPGTQPHGTQPHRTQAAPIQPQPSPMANHHSSSNGSSNHHASPNGAVAPRAEVSQVAAAPAAQGPQIATARPTTPAPQVAATTTLDHPALVSVEENQLGADWQGTVEQLPCHEMTVIVRGRQGTEVDGAQSDAGPVEAIVMRAGMQRREFNAGEVELHRLRVRFRWSGLSAELPAKVQDTCGRLHEIASWLVSERDAQFPNVQSYRQGLLSALLSEYLRLSVVAASRIEEKTRTYMLRHLGEPITLEDLASNIGMSRYYFCRVYKDVAGHTPMEHLRALRLERAKDLIRSTALPLKAIAPEVGFGSAQHLCRLLHDRFGVGVRELRGVGTLEPRGGDSRGGAGSRGSS